MGAVRETSFGGADCSAHLGRPVREGVGCEPASAATLAGLKKLAGSGFVKPHETVVLVLTGHMLKDVDYMKGSTPGQRYCPILSRVVFLLTRYMVMP